MNEDSQLIVKDLLNNLNKWNLSLMVLQLYILVFLLHAWYNGKVSLNKRY